LQKKQNIFAIMLFCCIFVDNINNQKIYKQMKMRALLLIIPVFMICACSIVPKEKGIGYLTLNISQSTSIKAGIETEDYVLRINDGHVDVLKKRIGDLLADAIELPAGTYTIDVYSIEFSDPKFEMPFYSGKTTVAIEAEETSEVSLVCSQGNAGIKVVWSDDFSTHFETYDAQIICNEGYLHYSSTEERTGYFLPGTVSVIINADGQTINAGNIILAARDIVTAYLQLKIEEIPPDGSLSINISIDETVNNREVEITVDPDSNNNQNSDNNESNPYNIAEAIERQGENGVWVTGYIVGAKPSTGYIFVVESNWQTTNLVLADDINETNDRNVIFVELQTGTYRNSLNLVNNPTHLHRKVLLKGNLLLYQSRAGLRNLSDNIYFQE